MNDNRVTLRLTDSILNRLDKIMDSGKYLNRSELIRSLIYDGLEKYEKNFER